MRINLACAVVLIVTVLAVTWSMAQVSSEDPLSKAVTLLPPYAGEQPGESVERISVQDAVRRIAIQAGLGYDRATSFKNTDPVCRNLIRPIVSGIPLRQALEIILKPKGLTYTTVDGQIVLNRLEVGSAQKSEALQQKYEGMKKEDHDAVLRSAERGDAQAQYRLGMEYYLLKNYEEAAKWFEEAAKRGQDGARVFMGRFYYDGLGVKQDYVQACMWFEIYAAGAVGLEMDSAVLWQDRVAAHLTPQQIADAGRMAREWETANRIGNPKQISKTARALLDEAEEGGVTAQYRLGSLYTKGTGLFRDYKEALKWFQKAAQQGHAGSMLALAAIYHKGRGVAKDDVQAYKWLCLYDTDPQNSGRNVFNNLRQRISARLTLEQEEEARRLAKEWDLAYQKTMGDGPYRIGRGVTAPFAFIKPLPSYAAKAREARVEGDVVVECIVRKDGIADSCRVLRGLGHGLDESVLDTVQLKWRFQPGTFLGKPVDVYADIDVFFNLR